MRPAPIGPYRPSVEAGGFLFTSGQIPLDPGTGRLVEGGIEAEAERAIRNLEAVLAAEGSTLAETVQVTVYLSDMKSFDAMNRVYERHFGEIRPARVCVGVAALPRGAAVEISAIARISARG